MLNSRVLHFHCCYCLSKPHFHKNPDLSEVVRAPTSVLQGLPTDELLQTPMRIITSGLCLKARVYSEEGNSCDKGGFMALGKQGHVTS